MAKRKRSHVQETEVKLTDTQVVPPVRSSDDPPPKKTKWTNKQRVLVFGSRGIIFRARHLMNNLKTLLPHTKQDSKREKNQPLRIINEICEMKNCNKCIYFESRKKKDLYTWISNVPNGPSAKFLVENVHTMEELKLTGNCLKGSRAILSFDKTFTEEPQYAILKELFTQTFGTPYHHPKSQPFIDHVFTFSVMDNRIWFRNYQIIEEDGSLVEIGPRFVLNPICILSGSFGGSKLFENPKYVSPNLHRRQLKLAASHKYVQRMASKTAREARAPGMKLQEDSIEQIFQFEKSDDEEEDEIEEGVPEEIIKAQQSQLGFQDKRKRGPPKNMKANGFKGKKGKGAQRKASPNKKKPKFRTNKR